MTTRPAPSPVALAARHGAGLRASAQAVQVMVPREVGLALKTTGPVAAWALVDGRHPDRPTELVNWGLIDCDLGATQRDRFRAISAEMARLHPTLAELAVGLPANHQVGVAYHGPSGAMGGLGDRMRDDDTMSFISPSSGTHIKALCAMANELCEELLEVCGVTHLRIATDGSVQRGRRGAGAGWVSSWGDFGCTPVDTSSIVVAEVVAIGNALADLPPGVTRVTVRVDSREAIAIANQALRVGATGGSLRVPAKAHAAAVRIHEAGRKVPVALKWVRGHSGDLMNETADRLAVMARRTAAADLSEEAVEGMAAGIMDDYYATANGVGGFVLLAQAA